ncbi:MAG: bifunctional folylpolyglutamate synthase/dihydrofolate synthase [Desulfovibrionales bacterium]
MTDALRQWGHLAVPTVQIVGTNGKGSVSAFLENLAREHGLTTGLFTSPHLLTPRERIRIKGRILSQNKWLEWANQLCERVVIDELTYFELLTMLAVAAFADEQVDLAVFEAGLGGRFDATTSLKRDMVVFTPIGLDHCEVLGQSLSEIARDKAAAMGPFPALTGGQEPSVLTILQEESKRRGGPLFRSDRLFSWRGPDIVSESGTGPVIPSPILRGEYQRQNGLLALAGWMLTAERTGWPIKEDACLRGLESTKLPGRFQFVPGEPDVLLDCAHNPAGMRALLHSIRESNLHLVSAVFICLKEKDLQGMISPLLELGLERIAVPEIRDNARARPAEEIVKALGFRGFAARDLGEALSMLKKKGPVLVCGSIYLIAEFFRLFPEHFPIAESD